MAWHQKHERMYREDVFAGRGPEPIYVEGTHKDAEVLDVGCGPGFWMRHFLRHGFSNVSVCDLTEAAVSITRQSLAEFGLLEVLDLRTANAEELPYADESLYHVNCQGVFHHTSNPQIFRQEFNDLLKPGGTLCFSVNYKNVIVQRAWLLKLVSLTLSSLVSLKGRGRKRLLRSGDAGEIVRLYDGADNSLAPPSRGKVFGHARFKMVGYGLQKTFLRCLGLADAVFQGCPQMASRQPWPAGRVQMPEG